MNTDNKFLDSMVNHIHPSELQLNKANVSDIKALFFCLFFLFLLFFFVFFFLGGGGGGWIQIYLYRMVLLRLKFMINEINFILIL